jgi:hypothetical protein
MVRAPSLRTPEQELFLHAQEHQEHKEPVRSPLPEPLIILSLAKSITKMFIQEQKRAYALVKEQIIHNVFAWCTSHFQ